MTETDKNWIRNIRLFIASQTISLFGSSLVQYAIMWYITLETKSGIMMTLSILCGFVPTFLLAPFAGVWADRFNRKYLIVLSDAMIAVVTLILALLFLNGYNAMWLLFVASAVRAFGTAVQMPAVSAFVPQIVPQEKLTRVNGINGSIQSAVMLVSPMISGALMTFATIEAIFFIDVVTAVIGISTLLIFLNVPAHHKALERQAVGYLTDLASGFHYIRNHDYVKSFFIFCGLFFFLAAPAAFLTPLQVARSFGDEVWRLTAVEISFSLGMMGGGILMAYWGGLSNRVYTMVGSTFIMGICTILLGITPWFWLYLAFMTLFGIAMPFFNTPATVLLQEKVEEDYRGRVFGVMTMITSSTMPLGMLVFGPISDVLKIEWLLLGTGIVMLIVCMLMLRNRTMVEAGRHVKSNDALALREHE